MAILMILLESNGQAAGPYQSLEERSVLSLAGRARISQLEERQTHLCTRGALAKDGSLLRVSRKKAFDRESKFSVGPGWAS